MIDEIQRIFDAFNIDPAFFSYNDDVCLSNNDEINNFKMKYAICKYVDPHSILGITGGSGCPFTAFFLASPDAEYLGIKSFVRIETDKSLQKSQIKKTFPQVKFRFIFENIPHMEKFPGVFYDLIYIEGLNEGDDIFHCLEMALEKGSWILIDGYFMSKERMLSITYFLEKYQIFIDFSLILSNFSGKLLIKTKTSAKHIFSKEDRAHYSSLQDTYDNRYFMQDCGGYDSFKKYHGQKLEDPRLVAAFCLANPEKSKTILDIGCGRGELAFALAMTGADVIGIDYSQSAINIAISTFVVNKNLLNLHFICADFLAWETPEKYDVVIATDIIEHIESAPLQKVMQKISSLLKPSGVAILHTAPNKHYYDKYYSHLRLKAREIGSYLPENPRTYYEDLMHINEQTPEELSSLLEKNFSNFRVWVARDLEMIGSLDENYPLEAIDEARGIFGIASNAPILFDKIVELLSQYPVDREKIKVRLQVTNSIRTVNVSQIFSLSITIINDSPVRLGSLPPYPIHLSYHWQDREGNVVVFEGERTQITPPIRSNDARELTMNVIAPSKSGEFTLQLTMVQEFTFWFEDFTPDLPISLEFLIMDE